LRVTFVAAPWRDQINAYPPLGVAYLAAALRSHGHEPQILDFGLQPDIPLEEAATQIAALKPELVGFTDFTHLHNQTITLAKEVRKLTDVPIVFGGPHPTVFPESTVMEDPIDYVVFGEGEHTIVALVNALDGRGNIADIEGLCYRSGGQAVQNRARPFEEDLDSLPFPARDLLEIGAYPLHTDDGEKMVTVVTSRGCPFSCKYCFKGVFGKRYRGRGAENIAAELKEIIDRYGIRNFYFVDDLFAFNKKRLHRWLDIVEAEGLDIRWQCLARPDILGQEDYRRMARAGCMAVHFGIETGDPEIMKRIGKTITVKDARNAVKYARRAGIHTKGYFMTGLPGDTVKTIKKTMKFAVSLRLHKAMFSLTTPFPGTDLWHVLALKYPAVSDKQKFEQAYYWSSQPSELRPFFNLSEVDDVTLARLTEEAQSTFWKWRTRRRQFQEKYGKAVGWLIWRVSLLTKYRVVASLKRRLVGAEPSTRPEEGGTC